MSPTSESRRIAGALRFLAALSAVAAECAATGAIGDELTARRRLRIETRPAEPVRAERAKKAL
jgi:hypothetical protein